MQTVHAATITVTNTNDGGAGSLRQELAAASDGDTINFSVTGTIILSAGELLVDKAITISGPGANTLSVNGNASSRVFHIAYGRTVTISGLTITNGSAGAGNGGGIWNDHAALTINNSTVSGNSASGVGGGIYNDAQSGGPCSSTCRVAVLIVNNSTMTGNSAGNGGAIFNDGAFPGWAVATITNSTISDNSGGAIYNDGDTGIGGVLFAKPGFAFLTVRSCTISGNSGPGIYNSASTRQTGINGYASLTVTNSTISGNGGGIVSYADNQYGAAPIIIAHTILASGVNIYVPYSGSTVTSLGYNLSSDGAGGFLTGPNDQINTDPMLGPLQDNGGPTFTHEPLTGSPAIDAGGPAEFDQRGQGYLRVVNHIDIGAVEVQATPTPVPVAPMGLEATDKTASSFTANWSSVTGATGYRLDVSTSSSFVTYVAGYQNLDVGNVIARSVPGLQAGTFYYYRLRAYNLNGTSPNSNIVMVKTKNR